MRSALCLLIAGGFVTSCAKENMTRLFDDFGRKPISASITAVPGSGEVGDPVTIIGNGFFGITGVTFNGTAATFTVTSGTQIAVTVPVGATSGPITVTSIYGSISTTSNFVVVSGIVLDYITVTPSTFTGTPGATQQLTVIATYSDLSTVNVTADPGTVYATSSGSIATVSAGGLVTLVAIGTATITATYSGESDTCAAVASLIYDFSGGTIPSGITVNTSGNDVYPQLSASTIAATGTTPGAGVGIFDNRGRGTGLAVFFQSTNYVRTDPVNDPVDSSLRFYQGWVQSGTGARTAAQGTGPDGVTVMDSINDSNAAGQTGFYTPGLGIPDQNMTASIWVRDCDNTEPTPFPAPSSPGILALGGSLELSTVSLGTGTTWRRINGMAAGIAWDIFVYPAGAAGDLTATGGILGGFASVYKRQYAMPYINTKGTALSPPQATANASDLRLTAPASAIVGGVLHVGGIFTQINLRAYDLIPTWNTTLGNFVYLFSMQTPDGLFAMRARYDSSQFEWQLVARGVVVLSSTRALAETGISVGAGYNEPVQWEAKLTPGGETLMRIGYRGAFHEKRGTDVGAAIPTPTGFYFHSNVTAEVLPGIVQKAVVLSNDTWTAPAFVLVGDSILDAGNAADQYDRVGTWMLSNAQVAAGLNNIENIAVHGHHFSAQATVVAAYPAALAAGVRGVVISMGWNDYQDAGPPTNGQIRTAIQALINACAAKFVNASIVLMTTTPGKAGVSAGAYALWQQTVADVTAGNIFTGVALQSNALATGVTFNDGAGNMVGSFDSGDGVHPNQLGKIAIGTAIYTALNGLGLIQ